MGSPTSRRTRSEAPSPLGERSADEHDPESDPETVARLICLRLLTVRDRSRAELGSQLRRRGVPSEAASAVLDRLCAVGLINDDAFAQAFAASRSAERGLASREITRQLREKGVSTETAAAAVVGIDAVTERATAERLVRSKLRSMSMLDDEAKHRRLVGLLARKGYSSSLAYSVVRAVVDTDGVPDPDTDSLGFGSA